MSEKMDVLDLMIQVLRDHERNLDGMINQLDKLCEKMDLEYDQNRLVNDSLKTLQRID